MSSIYVPGQVPNDIEDIPTFLQEEFRRISIAVHHVSAGHLEEVHVEPNKPRTGDIRFADGTNWNPGGGRGLYYYDLLSSAWIRFNI